MSVFPTTMTATFKMDDLTALIHFGDKFTTTGVSSDGETVTVVFALRTRDTEEESDDE